jgi:ADP-ribose pyrophosphatase
MSVEALDALAARGELTDSKTLVGMLWLHRWSCGAWPLRWREAG